MLGTRGDELVSSNPATTVVGYNRRRCSAQVQVGSTRWESYVSLIGPAYLATVNYGNIDYQAIQFAEGTVVNTREEVMHDVLRRMRLGEVRFLSMTGNVKDWSLNPNMSLLVL